MYFVFGFMMVFVFTFILSGMGWNDCGALIVEWFSGFFLEALRKLTKALNQASSDPAKIQTKHLANAGQVCYYYTTLLGKRM
jgi:hypothetical protein